MLAAMMESNEVLKSPRRRRSDCDLIERMAVVEAVQDEHRALFQQISASMQALVNIESENAVARRQAQEANENLVLIKDELPSLKLARYLVFTAALAVAGSAITFGWTIVYGAAQARAEAVKNANK